LKSNLMTTRKKGKKNKTKKHQQPANK